MPAIRQVGVGIGADSCVDVLVGGRPGAPLYAGRGLTTCLATMVGATSGLVAVAALPRPRVALTLFAGGPGF